MFKFSSFLKQKKILFFAFFLVFTLLVSIPNITTAASTAGCPQATGTTSGWCNADDQERILRDLTDSPEQGDLSVLGVTEVGKAIAMLIGKVYINVTYKTAAIAEVVLSFILGTVLSKPITSAVSGETNQFIPAWGAVRDLGNMLLVLGFVVVGIATALRIQSYAAKQLLWKLILIALFINFSGVFCGLIIDASNIITGGLTSGGTINYMPHIIMAQIFWVARAILTEPQAHWQTTNFMLNCLIFGAVFFGVAFTFLYLTILLIARYAILTMLWILSPLAFAFWVFPASQHLWSDWWKHFLKWCFIGVFGSFVLWMTNIILSTQPIFKAVANGGVANDAGSATWQLMIACGMVLIFLTVGFKMTASKTGVAALATTAVMGLASGGAMLASGAIAGAKGGAKALDQKALGGRGAAAAQSISNTTSRAMERIGIRATGTTAAANSKRVENDASLMSKEYTSAKATGDTATISRIQAQARTGRGVQGAAAMKVVADAKDIGTTFGTKPADLQKASDRMSNAESYGAVGVRSAAEKLDPRLAGYHQPTLDKQTPADIAKHGSASNAAIANAYSRANVSDIRNFNNDTLSDPAFIKNTSAKKIGRAGLEMSSSQVAAIKSHQPNMIAEQQRLTGIMRKNARGTTIFDAAHDKYQDGAQKYREVASL